MNMMPASVLGSQKIMGDNNKRHCFGVAENGELDTPVVSPCSSVDNDHEGGLPSDGNGDDIYENKIADFTDTQLLESLESAAESDDGSRYIAMTDEHSSDHAPVCNSYAVDGQVTADDDAQLMNLTGTEIDFPVSVEDKHERVDTSGSSCQHVEGHSESSDQAGVDTVSNGCLGASPVADANAESRYDQDSLPTTVPRIARDKNCGITNVNSESKISPSTELVSEKAASDSGCNDAADDELAGQSQSECAGDRSETAESAVTNDATGKCVIQHSVSASEVTNAGDGVSSATSLSTVVVVCAPLSSSESSSPLPSENGDLSAIPATTTTSPSRLSQLLQKPPPVVPLTTSTYNSDTRLMSRVLQDIGLLLVSQKVFKDLSNIQKRKLGSQELHSPADKEMLQKLKASHEKLAAKNRALLAAEQRCRCGYRSESVNVIEAHRLVCNVQGRCCYCQTTLNYHTQNQLKKHLWKAHKKVGRILERSSVTYCMCVYCPLQLSTHSAFLRHMSVCRNSFRLATNLAPRLDDKDIPIFSTTKKKKPACVPIVLTGSRPLLASVSQNAASCAPVLPTPVVSTAGATSSVRLQLTPVSRHPGPGTQLVQIGKQLFALLSSNTKSASSDVVVTKALRLKCVSGTTTSTMAQSSRSISTLPTTVRVDKPSLAVNAAAAVKTSTSQYIICPVCSAFVKDTSSLLVHMKIAHKSTHSLCQYCQSPGASFRSTAELNGHIMLCHTTDCWICRSRFQPAERLVEHIADRHKVTMAKMLELCRCYICSSVPGFLNYAKFEEHMIKIHSLHFPETSKLWDCVLNSADANRVWDMKQNTDGTLECPHCSGHFISQTFLYRHLHLQHDGILIKLVQCHLCKTRVPSAIMSDHLLTVHTQTCSVTLTRVNMLGAECIFVPPAGTRLMTKRKRPPAPKVRLVKRVKTAETVIISDDDDDECDVHEDKTDNSNDEDFVPYGVEVQPVTRQLRCSDRTRAGRRNSSVDDVREVLESIVDSGASQTVRDQSASFPDATHRSATHSQPGSHPCNGITEEEVEIIESIVPAICDRRQQHVGKVGEVKSTGGNKVSTRSVSGGKSGTHAKVVNNGCGTGHQGDLELVLSECDDADCKPPSTKPKSVSSAQQLMARDQIMMNAVEEVLEIDGETVLIVQSDNDGCT